MKALSSNQQVEPMGLGKFRSAVVAAVELLAKQNQGEDLLVWLNEDVLAGVAEAELEKFPADLGFQLGSATARFRRIAQEVAEANGHADPEQSAEAEAALRAIAEVLTSPRST